VIETLRERDGQVPEWVDTSAPVAAPSPIARVDPGGRDSGNQLTLSL
jgi:hypothetical protein